MLVFCSRGHPGAAFSRSVLPTPLYVPNSLDQSSLLPGDVSIAERQSSVASRRKKTQADKTQIQSNCFFIGSLEQATSNEDGVWGVSLCLYVLQQHTKSRLSSGISINTSSPYRPLEKPSLIPFLETYFMLQRGTPFLRHSPKKSSSISLESWLLIRELHFRCCRLFLPLHFVRILVFSSLLFFIVSFFMLYWFHLLSHCLLGPLFYTVTALERKRSKTA